MEQQQLVLKATPPFSFAQTLAFIEAFYAQDYERVPAHAQIVAGVRGRKLRRVVSVLERPVLLEVETLDDASDTPESADTLSLTLYAERLDDALIAAATDRVRFFLGLDDDLGELYRRADPIFAGVTELLRGYHMLKVLTPFEAACWALVQQRTPNPFAHKTMTRLGEFFGRSLTHEGTVYTAFPEARQLLDNPQARLLEATNNTRKTERLLSLIRAFATADEPFLRTAPYGEVAHWLGDIKGFGAWSVDFIMLRGLGRSERVPWADTGMLGAISRVYTEGFDISLGSARELAERYGFTQGIWAHYLKTAAYGPGRRQGATLHRNE